MHITRIRVQNYKCFKDTGDIILSPRFNIALGRNDAGKSALLEAASLAAGSKPHRSATTALHPSAVVAPRSVVECDLVVTGEEAARWLAAHTQFSFPVPSSLVEARLDDYVHALATALRIQIRSRWTDGSLQGLAWNPDLGDESFSGTLYYENAGTPTRFEPRRAAGGSGARILDLLATEARRRIFSMRAERMNIGESGTAAQSVLRADAANLPEVLNLLQTSRPAAFAKFIGYVRRIFQHITNIRVPPVSGGGNNVRIYIDTIDSAEDRQDLGNSLSDSGTGIGQVLAILYAILATDEGRFIIVDEPQSFLHPGAVRKLLEVMRENSQHQYLVSTHAPIALNDDSLDAVLLVSRGNNESTVQVVPPKDQASLRAALADIGARPSDVLGADAVLWVEGRTEEVCFPRLIRELAETPLIGVVVLGVVSTDELVSAKNTKRVMEVYERLTNASNALMPPARGFVFDREGRPATEMSDLDRRTRGQILWLGRRMFENYLLVPEAITSVLRGLGETTIDADIVQRWIAAQGNRREFKSAKDKPMTEPWLRDVHGGKVLGALFSELTDNRQTYDKVRHGSALCAHLVEHPTDAIRELAAQLAARLGTRE